MRRRAKRPKAKVAARLPAAREPRRNEGSRERQLEKRLAEVLDQQTATSEILRVISSWPANVQPVFDAIVRAASRLCDSPRSNLMLVAGEDLELVARCVDGSVRDTRDMTDPFHRAYPIRIDESGLAGLVVRERRLFITADAQHDERFTPARREAAAQAGFHSLVGVPMMRGGSVIGALNVARTEIRPYTAGEIQLLETFADQAVIAIGNVRLFKELEARNRDLAATSEVLQVISRSPTDARPVFDTIVRSAARLADGLFSGLLRFDGELIHFVAHHNHTPEALEEAQRIYPARPTRALLTGRAILERAVVHIPDIELDPEFQHRELSHAIGFRSGLWVPMLREGAPIGVIVVARAEPGRFSDKEIELLKTFADQAVIAIENVRLFTELQDKNRALTDAHAQVTEALEQQTATSEILRVIAGSPTDVHPVFDAIADSAMRLLRGWAGLVCRFDGELIHLLAVRGGPGEPGRSIHEHFPTRPTTGLTVGRCILECSVIQISDVETEADAVAATREMARARGWRSALAVPMLRDGQPIGAIMVSRTEAGPFTPAEIDLLRTFADQAAIAIENVRLFNELQARTAQLTRSVEQLTALGDVGRALSSTLDLDTVLQTIVTRASQLVGTDACSVFEYDTATEAFHLRATHHLDDEVVALARRTPTRKGEGVQGRMAITRQPIQIADIAEEEAYRGPLRDILLRTGTRAVLAIPMLREDQLIGGLTVNKKTPGEFSPEVVELLKTFATHSALAIQNARLFREIADKSHQLEVASQHKSEFLATMSHELRTPLNAIIGFSEVLSERMFGDLNEKQEEYLKDIHASGQHLLSLINDILDLSKIEAGRMELELTDFDLPTTIDNALTLVRERAGRRGIALHVHVDERLRHVRADERKVRQVLLNLLSNAIKFTPEGGRIEVLAASMDGFVEVSVSDTGIGIAPEDQEAVFEEFRQVGTADRKVEGTGLGLALSRKFIELHEGRIRVKSRVGEGSTFTFTLPVRGDRSAAIPKGIGRSSS